MRAAIALIPLAMIPLALLAACGDNATVDKKDASVAEVAKSVADSGMKLNPGRWEMNMKFTKLEVAGMPPEAKDMMQKMLGEGNLIATCLTKEQAEKPDASFFGQQGEDCRYDSFTMGGGKIDAAMTCQGMGGDAGAKAKITMAGTYSADAYDMTMNMDGKAPNGQLMTMAMAMKSKNVGACKGNETS